MPIIDADKAKTVIAIKRSMNPGFAGIENELYYDDKTLMAFGDAKQVLGDVVKAVSGEGRRALDRRRPAVSSDATEARKSSDERPRRRPHPSVRDHGRNLPAPR